MYACNAQQVSAEINNATQQPKNHLGSSFKVKAIHAQTDVGEVLYRVSLK